MSNILDLPAVRRRVAPISVETYHALSEQGLVDERTELLRGIIVEKMTKSPLHEFLANRIYELARAAAGAGLTVRKEGPLTLIDSEPEPDVVIVAGNPEEFRHSHPTTALLAVEVAVSTEEVDREKTAIYAEAGVAEYWLVLPGSQAIEVFSRPAAGAFTVKRVVRKGEVLESDAVPALKVDVGSLFG